jgi:hypothetical protein
MIEIKPNIQHQSNCPHCKTPLQPSNVIWHGMHICTESKCTQCDAEIIEDLKVGHGITYNQQIDLKKNLRFGSEDSILWLGEPLLQALKNPQKREVKITKEIIKPCQQVIILNCIDFLYGHSLLKLLNAQKEVEDNPNYGVIIIVQKFLRWMIPEGVAEIWTVDIPLKAGNYYYLNFHNFITEEIKRFEKVYISKAYSHPSEFDLSRFTGISKHDFNSAFPHITFIWREDRVWMLKLALFLQNRRINKLFKRIKLEIPSASFYITGLGTQTKFPNWIQDARVSQFDKDTEEKICQLYSKSSLVIGIHGSNMLLPSGHAGMTIDLMPTDRWGNFAQDILYQEEDPRMAAYKYRYLPEKINTKTLAEIASSQILKYSDFLRDMTAAKTKG